MMAIGGQIDHQPTENAPDRFKAVNVCATIGLRSGQSINSRVRANVKDVSTMIGELAPDSQTQALEGVGAIPE